MKHHLLSLAIIILLFSCKTKPKSTHEAEQFRLLIPDTTNNQRAHWDLDDLAYRSKLESQIGLTDLKKGTDSLEVRLWYDFSMGIAQELYVLKLQDTSCWFSYYRTYSRRINYDDENRDRNWDSYKDPIVDSTLSKTILLPNRVYNSLHVDSAWLLKSQSELKISDSIGFLDCYSCIIEIANKKRFKYLRHHCAMSYYRKTKLPEILAYVNFCDRIVSVAQTYKVVIPYR